MDRAKRLLGTIWSSVKNAGKYIRKAISKPRKAKRNNCKMINKGWPVRNLLSEFDKCKKTVWSGPIISYRKIQIQGTIDDNTPIQYIYVLAIEEYCCLLYTSPSPRDS